MGTDCLSDEGCRLMLAVMPYVIAWLYLATPFVLWHAYRRARRAVETGKYGRDLKPFGAFFGPMPRRLIEQAEKRWKMMVIIAILGVVVFEVVAFFGDLDSWIRTGFLLFPPIWALAFGGLYFVIARGARAANHID